MSFPKIGIQMCSFGQRRKKSSFRFCRAILDIFGFTLLINSLNIVISQCLCQPNRPLVAQEKKKCSQTRIRTRRIIASEILPFSQPPTDGLFMKNSVKQNGCHSDKLILLDFAFCNDCCKIYVVSCTLQAPQNLVLNRLTYPFSKIASCLKEPLGRFLVF